jgi:hypothetical protein
MLKLYIQIIMYVCIILISNLLICFANNFYIQTQMIHMETVGSPAVAMKNKTLTPKSIIIQKFDSEANFEVEEVQPAENGCPGLAISQKGPCLYRCILQLPGIAFTSETFKKKKDAEQSAAEMAIEKVLSISLSTIIFIISLAGQLYLHTLSQSIEKENMQSIG